MELWLAMEWVWVCLVVRAWWGLTVLMCRGWVLGMEVWWVVLVMAGGWRLGWCYRTDVG